MYMIYTNRLKIKILHTVEMICIFFIINKKT